ncbi:Gfo/Idh/MocA family protein [Actinoplanes xinjiangensis]|uniref:Putative dehydrogenase n=1 Tax=Actinoplanes xinjiangensis TaxID=512350 RepID=A0A316F7U3_9ACTN|nr:Gfo/Idh/MocA family oxidoreductase [Actinoplanes xinjiangensis]PWK40502.1 putative dehydrogenase [Actinoplanes xinjiangensis]GIF42278.1 oxidoreductase [Actinoplanes xinjiangensis]
MRIGIVGCGRIAHSHVRALRGVEGVHVAAVADVDAGRARAFAAQHGVDRSFGDLDRMLDIGLDAVTICTPHAEHESGVLAAARHGTHVLCEKPIALRVEQGERMIATTTAAGVRFGVLFQRRFWPAAADIRAAIDDGRMGPPICGGVVARLNRGADYYRAEPWRGRRATEGGGVLMTQVIHHIDLLQWFMGPARRVTGRCANLAHQDVIEVEDTAAALIEFSSGAVATVQAGTTFQPGLGVQVWVGDARGRTASVMEFPEGVGFTDVRTLPGEETFAGGYVAGRPFDLALSEIHEHLAPYHARQIADFVAALRADREPAVTGRDALRSLAIVEAVYESSRTGSAVELPS